MRDNQRGAVVVAGVVLQDDNRAGAALLGAYVGVEVGQIHVAPAVNPVFLHAVSPFLSFVSFDIPQSEKAGHVQISLAVVSVLYVHIASPCPLSLWFFGYVRSLICPRRPESRESIRRRCAAPLHRNRTSPPSLWPGRELRKYHCPQHLSSPPPGAARLLSCKLYRSLMWVPVKVRDFDGRGGAAQ